MATLIPALNSCKPRMTSCEHRLAERLEDKLNYRNTTEVRQVAHAFAKDALSIVPLYSSKGLEFPVVAISGVGYMPNATEIVSDKASSCVWG